MDPSMMSQITYHSRRRDQPLQQAPTTTGVLFYGNNSTTGEEFSYGPIVNVTKKLYQEQQYDKWLKQQKHPKYTSNQQSITKQSYLQNLSTYTDNNDQSQPQYITNPNLSQNPLYTNTTTLPSFANLGTTVQCNLSKNPSWQGPEQQLMKQKIKTLSQHLKSSLQINSEIEQKCNALRKKLEQKQEQHMNQLASIKAQVIICENGSKQKSTTIEQQTNRIADLQKRISMFQQQQILMSGQLQKLNKQLQSNSHQAQLSQQQHQHYIQQLQLQLINHKESYQTLSAEYSSINKESQAQRDRIARLNMSINQLCQQSQHLFGQINQLKAENETLYHQIAQMKSKNEALRQQGELFNQRLSQYNLIQQSLLTKQDKLCQLQHLYQDFQGHHQDLRVKYHILQQQYTQLSQKHTDLQQQNILINKNNSSLIEQIQLLNSQIKEFKQAYLNQSISKESQLQTKVQLLEARADGDVNSGVRRNGVGRGLYTSTESLRENKVSKESKNLMENKNLQSYRKITQQYQPTLQPNNYHSKQSQLLKMQIIKQQQQERNITQPTKQYSTLIPASSTQPYRQYLSFQIPKRRVSTCAAQRQQQTIPSSQLPLYRRNHQLNKRSKSTYIERNLYNQQQISKVYNNIIDPNHVLLKDKNNSLRSMRHSLDLRDKSLQLKTASQNLYNQSQSLLHKNTQIQTIYSSQQHQDPNNSSSRTAFLSKLDKMKLWANQSSTQNNTQRQPLTQLLSSSSHANTSYLINRDVPVHTIIKQKSSMINSQRKNLLNFSLNVNNQMVQKNILKLQKTNNTGQSSNRLTMRQDSNSGGLNLSKQNNISDLSPICQEPITNKKLKQNNTNSKLTSAIYQNCKKVLYNHTGN